jgi:hypothetical protein
MNPPAGVRCNGDCDEIGYFVMVITSAEAVVWHVAPHKHGVSYRVCGRVEPTWENSDAQNQFVCRLS